MASGQFKEFGDDSLFEGLSTINRNCGHLRPSVLLVYTQMVLYLLKDKNGQSFYDDRELDSNIISCYYSFMRLVSELRRESVVNVHTLNHDLLFEALAKTESVWGRVSDGFDEYGSEYFGKLRIGNNSYYCCLDRYVGKYDTGLRLFKLHGSIDYVPFSRKADDNIFRLENYVKIKSGISPTEILRNNEKKDGYELSPFECHADFLSGHKHKQLRYEEPVLYKRLLDEFRSNLRKSAKLIIIGYGCKDDGINSIVKESFDYKNKPAFIVDNRASDCVKDFANSISA